MGRKKSPLLDIDVDAPRLLRSGAVSYTPSVSVKRGTQTPSASVLTKALPPRKRIGPPRGKAPNRQRPTPTRRASAPSDADDDPFSPLLLDPFNKSASSRALRLARPTKAAVSSHSEEDEASGLHPAKLATPQTPPPPPPNPQPPHLPSRPFAPTQPVAIDETYGYEYLFTPHPSPNSGRLVAGGAIRYEASAPVPGQGGPRNDRTWIVLPGGLKVPIPPGYVAPLYYDLQATPRDDGGDDSSGGVGPPASDDGQSGQGPHGGSAEDDASMWEGFDPANTLHSSPDVVMHDVNMEDSSGSDYESTRRQKDEQRVKLRKRGRDSPDTEQEDREEDAELQDDVVADDPPRRPSTFRRRSYKAKTQKRKLRRSPSRIPASAKGKSRQAEPEVEKTAAKKSCGRWSLESLQEVKDFGDTVYAQAEALASKYNKPATEVLFRAGLGIKINQSRPNYYNKYKQWYSRKYPQQGGTYLFLRFIVSA
jgi:hypothetical protein